MKRKGGYNAYEIDMDYRHEQYMKRKAKLKKEEKNHDIYNNGSRTREEME